ncbi:hypothetical protein BC936DRAFT_149925, partial [Jimgerdemannia flammicorona]
WNDFKIQLIVVTDKRPHSLSRLIRSISHAHYLGDQVPMSINMEQTADKVTRLFVSTFPWPHGPKNVRHRIRKGGLMPAIVEAWYPADNNDYAIFLEDDVEVSPLFYVWVKFSILRYRYGPDRNMSSNMFGVSLYSPRNTEMGIEGRRPFHPDWVLNTTSHHPRTPYLLQVPCSWGAVYFPEHWREYHDYITARLVDIDNNNLQNITIPNARSNRWYNSWKRYFIELIYLRGYVMLYPNFRNFTSFSTNHLEFGTHVKHQRKAINQFLVPLMERDTILSELPQSRLPEWTTLPVLDLWANLESIPALMARGRNLRKQVSACLMRENDADRFDPQDLLCPYPPKKNETELMILNGTYPNATDILPEFISQTLTQPPISTVFIYITVTPQPNGQNEEYAPVAISSEILPTSVVSEVMSVVEQTPAATPFEVPNANMLEEHMRQETVPADIDFELKPIDPSEDSTDHEDEDQETLDLEEDLANMDRLEEQRRELEQQHRAVHSDSQTESEQPLSIEDIMAFDLEDQDDENFDWGEEEEGEEEVVVSDDESNALIHPMAHQDAKEKEDVAPPAARGHEEEFVEEEGVDGNGVAEGGEEEEEEEEEGGEEEEEEEGEEEIIGDENMDRQAIFDGEEDGRRTAGRGRLMEPMFMVPDDGPNALEEPA